MRKTGGSPLVCNTPVETSKSSTKKPRPASRHDAEAGDPCGKEKSWAMVTHGRTKRVKKNQKKLDPGAQLSHLLSRTRWQSINTPKKSPAGVVSEGGKLEWDKTGRPRWIVEAPEESSSGSKETVVRKPLAYLDGYPYTKWSQLWEPQSEQGGMQ